MNSSKGPNEDGSKVRLREYLLDVARQGAAKVTGSLLDVLDRVARHMSRQGAANVTGSLDGARCQRWFLPIPVEVRGSGGSCGGNAPGCNCHCWKWRRPRAPPTLDAVADSRAAAGGGCSRPSTFFTHKNIL